MGGYMLCPATGESFLSELQCLSGVPMGRCVSVPLPVQDCTLKEAHLGVCRFKLLCAALSSLTLQLSYKATLWQCLFLPCWMGKYSALLHKCNSINRMEFHRRSSRTTHQMSGGHNHPALPILWNGKSVLARSRPDERGHVKGGCLREKVENHSVQYMPCNDMFPCNILFNHCMSMCTTWSPKQSVIPGKQRRQNWNSSCVEFCLLIIDVSL